MFNFSGTHKTLQFILIVKITMLITHKIIILTFKLSIEFYVTFEWKKFKKLISDHGWA
jgi:hypothetical protein